MKTLASSIADRINELTPASPSHSEAIVHYLTIIDRAEDLKYDPPLVASVGTAMTLFGLDSDVGENGILGRRVAAKLAALYDPRSMLKVAHN